MPPTDATHEDRQSLWTLTVAPAVWAVHFLASYGTASVWCARHAAEGTLGPVRPLVAAFTVAALAVIALAGWGGWRRHTHGEGGEAPHDEDTPEDRHRFLGLATLLLAGLSGVATLFVGGSTWFFWSCR